MKKRNFALLSTAAMLSLALAGSIGAVVTASASEITQDSKDPITTTVTYNVDTTWKLTIPESIVVEGEEATVSASDVTIEKGETFKVTVASANEWKVESGEQSLDYDLKVNDGPDALTNGGEVLSLDAGTQEGSATLKATLDNEDEKKYSTGGKEYEDTLTFTVSDGTEA